jgi:hypothetical protein
MSTSSGVRVGWVEVKVPLEGTGGAVDIGFKESVLSHLWYPKDVDLFAAEMEDQLADLQRRFKGASSAKVVLSPYLLQRLGGPDVLCKAIQYLFRMPPLGKDPRVGEGRNPVEDSLRGGGSWV